jgi:Skp family chaperone for outer membrane proteins
MKKVIMMLSLLLTIVVSQSFAQNDKAKKENFGWQKMYMDSAGISADVQTKIEAIKKDYDPQIKAIRKDATLAEDAKKEKMKELRKKMNDEINALLTKEQKAKIKAIKEGLKKEGE